MGLHMVPQPDGLDPVSYTHLICKIFNTDPAQPAFGFIAPITTLGIRACTIAPAHI